MIMLSLTGLSTSVFDEHLAGFRLSFKDYLARDSFDHSILPNSLGIIKEPGEDPGSFMKMQVVLFTDKG